MKKTRTSYYYVLLDKGVGPTGGLSKGQVLAGNSNWYVNSGWKVGQVGEAGANWQGIQIKDVGRQPDGW